jgi:hypothetical protein
MQIHQLGRGLVADALAAAADVNVGAEFKEPRGHRFAEPGAAAGDKDTPAREKLLVEHRFHPNGLLVDWLID